MFSNQDLFQDYQNLTKEKLNAAMQEAINRTRAHIPDFRGGFPSTASKNGIYQKTGNVSWTEGFYTGVLWICYEMTGEELFRTVAEEEIDSFYDRIVNKENVDHHDMGYLYSLSCVAGYKLTGNEKEKKAALLAADQLIARFQEKGQFIQAWGEMGKEDNYRLIIDCLLNLPLLYWASEVSGKEIYKKIAHAHLHTAAGVVFRPDASTHHTYYFDPETGAPKYGKTHQGYSDDSAWARGQSWGVYGLMLNYIYQKEDFIPPLWERVTDYFLEHLPSDRIAYWDLCFTDGADQPRDSSSDSITVCGILEAYRQGICGEEYLHAAMSMMNALIDTCTTKDQPESNGLVLHSTYSIWDGTDECNIWGDYFYMEALIRFLRDWKLYW